MNIHDILARFYNKIRDHISSRLSAFYTKSEIDLMGGGTSLDTTIKSKANDSDVVHKSGDEIISGVKGISFISDRVYDGLVYGHTGDEENATTTQKANLTLASWNSIGMWSTYTNNYSIGFDVRHGNVYANDFITNGVSCAVTEQGGDYIRYSNGLQICWGTVYVGNTGGAPRSFGFTFGRSFAVPPIVTVGRTGANSGEFRGGTEGINTTTCAGFVWTTADNYVYIIAIGRWK